MRFQKNIVIFITAISMLALSSTICLTANAGTINITTTDDESHSTPNGLCSLREAITSTNTNSPLADCPVEGTLELLDTIMVPPGTYKLTRIGSCEDNNEMGDLDITEPVNIIGAGANSTIIVGISEVEMEDRVFDVLVAGGSPAFAKSVAPIPVQKMTISGVTVRGGIVPFCSEDPSANDGGGIRNGLGMGSPMAMMPISSASLLLNSVIVMQNGARDNGGGIANFSAMTIENSTIHSNAAGMDGGGIFNGGDLLLINSTISNNMTYENGGGIGAGSFSYTFLRNVTITENTADFTGEAWGSGGGIALDDFAPSALFLRNTILAGNIDKTLVKEKANNMNKLMIRVDMQSPDCTYPMYATIMSEGYNLIGNNSGCNQPGYDGPWISTDQVGDVAHGGAELNAGLLPLSANGGPTPTHALNLTSPAIDRGNNVKGCTSDDEEKALLTTDQRGTARPLDSDQKNGAVCEIGAYEYRPTACGDKLAEGSEQCDDGNITDGDGCSAICTNEKAPACGDGILQAGEGCDDSNILNGDSCSSTCTVENSSTGLGALSQEELVTYLIGRGGCSLTTSSPANTSLWLLIIAATSVILTLHRFGRKQTRSGYREFVK